MPSGMKPPRSATIVAGRLGAGAAAPFGESAVSPSGPLQPARTAEATASTSKSLRMERRSLGRWSEMASAGLMIVTVLLRPDGAGRAHSPVGAVREDERRRNREGH